MLPTSLSTRSPALIMRLPHRTSLAKVLLGLPEVSPAAGKAATLEAFVSLKKALAVCDADLSRPDPAVSGSWGWGRRNSSWGRKKRADGPFDPDAAALVRGK